jgi:hypothetical protein
VLLPDERESVAGLDRTPVDSDLILGSDELSHDDRY